jgi:hypothetical protein
VATLWFGLRLVIGPQQKETGQGCSVSLAMRTGCSLSVSGPAPRVDLPEDADRVYATSALSTLP